MSREGSSTQHRASSPPLREAWGHRAVVLGMLSLVSQAAWGAAVVIQGTGSADVINVASASVPHEVYGKGGDDRITGSSAADTLDGGYGYDRLNGGPGGDFLVGGPGNDTLDGGLGLDFARYERARASYAVTGSVSEFQIRALSGSEGTDTLASIDFVDFSDGRYAVADLFDTPAPGDALLNLIAAAPEGSWVKVNGNRFQDVWTPVLQRARVNGSPLGEPRKIITAWSSMAWDDNRRQLIIWGGGHANYAGNDVYRFDARTLRWQRASLPSAVHAPLGDNQYFAVDGAMNAPTSSHTYDNQEFLPLLDRFITFGGAKYNGGQVFVLDDGVTKTGPYLWDPSRAGADMVGGTTGSHVNAAIFPNVIGARMWQNRDTIVNNGLGAARPSWFVNGTTAYAVENGSEVIYVNESPRTGGDLFRYRIAQVDDPNLDRWEFVGVGAKSYSDQGAGAYDPLRRVYLRTARFSSSYGIVMWNTATPGPTNGAIRFIPRDTNGAAIASNLHGMDFDPIRNVFVMWDGGGDVWYLRPPASGPAFTINGWTATRAPVAGPSRPAIHMSTGILGKWKYIRSHDVMMGLGDGYEGQVWVYKPVGWQPP